MGAFHSLDIARSGVRMASTWLDVLAHNVANVNTATNPDDGEPFRAQLVRAEEIRDGLRGGPGDGVQVVSIDRAEGDPPLVYDPMHPLANEDGLVAMPVMDLAGSLADLVLATRTYQVNISVAESSKEAYEAAMRLGRR
jgi:flagellar basal-body rod protein FlgC